MASDELHITPGVKWTEESLQADCSQCGATHTLTFELHTPDQRVATLERERDEAIARVERLEAMQDAAISLLKWHEAPSKGMKGGEIMEDLDRRIEAMKEALAEVADKESDGE